MNAPETEKPAPSGEAKDGQESFEQRDSSTTRGKGKMETAGILDQIESFLGSDRGQIIVSFAIGLIQRTWHEVGQRIEHEERLAADQENHQLPCWLARSYCPLGFELHDIRNKHLVPPSFPHIVPFPLHRLKNREVAR